MSFILHDLGTEGVAVSDESIEVRCGNLGVIDPLGEKLMIDVRGRNRAGEMIAFRSCKTFDYGRNVLAGTEVLLEKTTKSQ